MCHLWFSYVLFKPKIHVRMYMCVSLDKIQFCLVVWVCWWLPKVRS